MARCGPVTDPSAGIPANEPDSAPEADAADAGWRALAGSLDDPGFAHPPALPIPPAERPEPAAVADPGPPPSAPPAAPAVWQQPTRSGHPRPRQYPRVAVAIVVAQLAAALIILGGVTIQLPHKAVIAPGATADIEDFVEVAGHPAYPSEAAISLVSVRTSFAPTLFEVIGGWLDGALEVVDLVDILGERTVAENRNDGRLQMDQSTFIAVAVALEHLGYEIMTPIGARVQRVMADAPADDALRPGDIVLAVDDTVVATAQDLSATIKAQQPGARAALLALDPDGRTRTVNVTLADRDGVALLGVIVTTHVEFEEFPIDVTLNIDNIGGPSAGLAFTLSVIDALTPESLTGDLDVVATGTIYHDGAVGPIGGVPQKSHAVVRSGADLFLVPASQAEAAVAVAEPSVAVVGVETLQDALAAIETRRS